MLKQWEHALDCEFLSRHDRIALRLTHTFILRYERTFKLNCSSPLRLHPQGQSSLSERIPHKQSGSDEGRGRTHNILGCTLLRNYCGSDLGAGITKNDSDYCKNRNLLIPWPGTKISKMQPRQHLMCRLAVAAVTG